MRIRLFAAVLFALVTRSAAAAPLAWENDWNTAFQRARAEHKAVFVDFFANWCGPCKWMDEHVFSQSTVQETLGTFVLLRVNVDIGGAATVRRVRAFPTYIIYDSAERERFRITGAKPADVFEQALGGIVAAMPRVIEAGDLLDQKRDVEAGFLLGNTYLRLRLADFARDAYSDAAKAARRGNDDAKAQVAEVQRAFTWAVEGKPQKTVKELKKLSVRPVNPENAALIWLTLGRAHETAKERASAVNAYRQVQTVAAADSSLYREAAAALEKLGEK